MNPINWREYPAEVPAPERHGSPLYLVRIEYDGTEAIVYDWFIRRPSDEEIETRNLGVDYPDDYVGEWSENENVTHWIPASELLATDAARASLRAEGVESYADSIALRLKDKELSMRQKERLNFSLAEVKAYIAELHNSQLRESKGAQK